MCVKETYETDFLGIPRPRVCLAQQVLLLAAAVQAALLQLAACTQLSQFDHDNREPLSAAPHPTRHGSRAVSGGQAQPAACTHTHPNTARQRST